jgi:hypothetical protein
MTLVSTGSVIAWPGHCISPNGGSTSTEATLDASGEYTGLAFQAREDMVVSHVGFRCGTATGSPTLELRMETIDPATGLPSGTLWNTNTNVTTGTLSSNTDVVAALTASATINRGQSAFLKVLYASGTSVNVMRSNAVSGTSGGASAFPYRVINTGTPTKSAVTASQAALYALGSGATSFYYVPGTIPANAVTHSTFNNTSSAKRGLRFTPPFKCRCVGIRYFQATSVGDFNAILMSDAGSELSSSSTAIEGDVNAASSAAATDIYFDNPVTLDAGTAYRAVIEPSSATNCNVSFYTLPSADYRSAKPGGSAAMYTTFAGSWTDSTTEVPLMDILIDQIDDGAGSGGGARQKVYGG